MNREEVIDDNIKEYEEEIENIEYNISIAERQRQTDDMDVQIKTLKNELMYKIEFLKILVWIKGAEH